MGKRVSYLCPCVVAGRSLVPPVGLRALLLRLCVGLSKSARCAGAAKGPTFGSALVVDGCYRLMGTGHRRELVGTVRAGAVETRRSRRFLLSTGVICVLMLHVSWVELVWVGSDWFGLSCWVF